MPMDKVSEPLYSAEQIAIPAELAFVLKEFTKAVIRSQPQDIIAFSKESSEEKSPRRYRHIVVSLTSLQEFLGESLTAQQLSNLRTKLMSSVTGNVRVEELRKQAAACGIKITDVDGVLRLGDFGPIVDYVEFIALASTLLVQDLPSAMKVLFNIFTETEQTGLSPDVVLKLFQCLSKQDRDMSIQFTKAMINSIKQSKISITLSQFLHIYQTNAK